MIIANNKYNTSDTEDMELYKVPEEIETYQNNFIDLQQEHSKLDLVIKTYIINLIKKFILKTYSMDLLVYNNTDVNIDYLSACRIIIYLTKNMKNNGESKLAGSIKKFYEEFLSFFNLSLLNSTFLKFYNFFKNNTFNIFIKNKDAIRVIHLLKEMAYLKLKQNKFIDKIILYFQRNHLKQLKEQNINEYDTKCLLYRYYVELLENDNKNMLNKDFFITLPAPLDQSEFYFIQKQKNIDYETNVFPIIQKNIDYYELKVFPIIKSICFLKINNTMQKSFNKNQKNLFYSYKLYSLIKKNVLNKNLTIEKNNISSIFSNLLNIFFDSKNNHQHIYNHQDIDMLYYDFINFFILPKEHFKKNTYINMIAMQIGFFSPNINKAINEPLQFDLSIKCLYIKICDYLWAYMLMCFNVNTKFENLHEIPKEYKNYLLYQLSVQFKQYNKLAEEDRPPINYIEEIMEISKFVITKKDLNEFVKKKSNRLQFTNKELKLFRKVLSQNVITTSKNLKSKKIKKK